MKVSKSFLPLYQFLSYFSKVIPSFAQKFTDETWGRTRGCAQPEGGYRGPPLQ
jgi:hypothetical protein